MTLRTRIALMFMGLVALLLGVFGVFVYLKSSHLRTAEFNERLRERADVAGRLVTGTDKLPPEARERLQRQLLNALPNEALAVYTSTDSLVLEQATNRFRPEPFHLQQAHQKGLHTWEEGPRQFLVEVVGQYPDTLFVAVAAEDKLGYEQLNNLSVALIWGGLLGVSIAGVIAWLLAVWAIKPVKALTRQALQIQSPSQRLILPNRMDELGHMSIAFMPSGFNEHSSRMPATNCERPLQC
jgi:hypothetical protein